MWNRACPRQAFRRLLLGLLAWREAKFRLKDLIGPNGGSQGWIPGGCKAQSRSCETLGSHAPLPQAKLCSYPCIQVLPKLSSSIVHEIDSILGNKPYSKKDYRS